MSSPEARSSGNQPPPESHTPKVISSDSVEQTQPVGRPGTPTEMARRFATVYAPDTVDTLVDPPPPTPTPQQAGKERRTVSRRAVLLGGAALGGLALSRVVAPTIFPQQTEQDSRSEDEAYLDMIKRTIAESFSNQFGPVLQSNPHQLAYPEASTFARTRITTPDGNPAWALNFNLLDTNLGTTPIKMFVVVKNNTTSQKPSEMLFSGNVTPLFGRLSTAEDRVFALQALVKNSQRDRITETTTPTSGSDDERVNVAKEIFEMDDTVTAETSIQSEGAFEFKRIYK